MNHNSYCSTDHLPISDKMEFNLGKRPIDDPPRFETPLTHLAFKDVPRVKSDDPIYHLKSLTMRIENPRTKAYEIVNYNSDHGFSCMCTAWVYRREGWDCSHIIYAKNFVNGN
jgi:hypothetical protein